MEAFLENLIAQLSFEEQGDINLESWVYVCVEGGVCVCV